MNAHSVSSCAVRPLDLTDRSECQRIARFLDDHQEATPFHRPAWSRAVAKGCGQRAHYLVAESASGALAGLLPLTEVRSRLFGSALVSAGFGVGGGILAGNSRAAAALSDAAVALAQARHCPTIELRGGWLPPHWHCQEGVYAGFARPLAATEAAILASIPRKQRAEVRRASALDWSVGRTDGDLDRHFTVYAQSVRNLGTPVFPRGLFRAMRDEWGENCDVVTISDRGQVLASVFSLYDKGSVYPYWGGGTFSARSARANEALYFRLMVHAAGRGCTRFDFGRSKLGTGAYQYKKNWGFAPDPLAYALHSLSGAPPRAVNPLDPRYARKIAMWRRLPLWAANLLGPPIARGLG